MNKKYVYAFSEGNAKMNDLLGGKGANLAEMTALGLPVPPGFTVSTEACARYYGDGKLISEEISDQIYAELERLEEKSGKKLGDVQAPLLLSVRSGSRASMPGMMDTILNLGINDEVCEALSKITGNPRFAYDSHARFIQMFSEIAAGLPSSLFKGAAEELKKEKGASFDVELSSDDLKILVGKFKGIYLENVGSQFPSDPKIQLMEAVKAVFRSWDNPRADVYRRMNGIPYSWGTAVNVQAMVFGNFGDTSGSGVAFSRNPSTGENKLFGEYLINAQGEDVVAGIRTPRPIDELKVSMPEAYSKLVEISKILEDRYLDMQDMEFTIENGKPFMLQTRNAKRTAAAALKVASDFVREGKISKDEALLRVAPNQLNSLLHPRFDKKALKKVKPIGKGLAASPGAACGKAVFDAQSAKERSLNGEKVILVRLETSPEDVEGMIASEGILTARGGTTSHAAVVARGIGVCCVSGCEDIEINEAEKSFVLSGKTVKEGDFISLDGSTGNIYGAEIKTIPSQISKELKTFLSWADSKRKLKTFANADVPADVRRAIEFGAEGIGLCRTEHMFFSGERIDAIREMILAGSGERRRAALDRLLPYQKKDFVEIFSELKGLPATIRFLDPPLHEFLPKNESEAIDLSKKLGVPLEEIKAAIEKLKEFNPMMGHRGCRLAISYPEIAGMQTSAVIGAAIEVSKKHPEYETSPEIMIPLVGDEKELKFIKREIEEVADELIKNSGVKIKYKIGTMIEIPRAALTADKIAREAEFFSFGTNDLTQLTLGFSRDDSSKFLDYYYKNKILDFDPFSRLDEEGVGGLIKTACDLGRRGNPGIKLGVCGEHGGDPLSIEFFNDIGVDYVSCSPYRIPVARLAAAQAQIRASRRV